MILVNWVERKHEREMTIAAKAQPIWDNLSVAVKESVNSFNRIYRQQKKQAAFVASSAHIVVSMELPLQKTSIQASEMVKHAKAEIALNASEYFIACTYEHSIAKDVKLTFDVEEDFSEAFLRHGDIRIAKADSAAEIILEEFFQELTKQ
jgi:hypothetical protein